MINVQKALHGQESLQMSLDKPLINPIGYTYVYASYPMFLLMADEAGARMWHQH
jgi:hypothetical protein